MRAFALLALVTAFGAACADEDRGARTPRCEGGALAPRPDGLVVAGSGTNLAPFRLIAGLFERRVAGARVHVAASIGTKGAIRALTDGAIDVGLASRPLAHDERTLGIEEHRFARVGLGPVVPASQPRGKISTAEVTAIYAGDTRSWPDGTVIVPVLRQPGDSSTRAIEAWSPALGAAMRDARESERALTRYTDQDLRDTLLDVPGAIGFLDTGTIALESLPLKPLALDGTYPDGQPLQDGSYPLAITLSLLTRKDATAEVRSLVEFAGSAEVANALAAAGYDVEVRAAEGGP